MYAFLCCLLSARDLSCDVHRHNMPKCSVVLRTTYVLVAFTLLIHLQLLKGCAPGMRPAFPWSMPRVVAARPSLSCGAADQCGELALDSRPVSAERQPGARRTFDLPPAANLRCHSPLAAPLPEGIRATNPPSLLSRRGDFSSRSDRLHRRDHSQHESLFVLISSQELQSVENWGPAPPSRRLIVDPVTVSDPADRPNVPVYVRRRAL
ncbi:hypothetical protein BDY21DRAFT_207137 [Lineolata rhizophorae]|uniref:Uncharacterized protein n=1 Tax=Lineolata rhizophorae TaxID=578093 RepID=A0A6A6P456_9PEZI|nr:hypothetical protein BDY21DRAFT_207137 [Lineolata rhizophorae]